MKVLVICSNLLIVRLNLFSIFLGKFASQDVARKGKHLTSRTVIKFLKINDLFFSFNLISLIFAEYHYGNAYVLYRRTWLSNFCCKMFGFVGTFVMFNSIFFSNMVTIIRFVSVKFPFNTHLTSPKVIIKYLSTGCCYNFLICMLSFLYYFIIEQKNVMPSKTCLFLGETLESVTIKCVTILMITFQIASCMSIVIFYSIIINELKKPKTIHSSKVQDNQLSKVTILVITINMLCWLPSSIIYIISVTAETYPTELLTWKSVLINPVNSIMNPVIFWLLQILKNF